MNDIRNRSQTVTESMSRIENIINFQGVNRASLEKVTQELITLAAHKAFWICPEFSEPKAPELTAFYLIHNAESGFALYLNIMRPGEYTPVHNHTTWASIASVEGVETNFLYKQVDDCAQAGYSKLEQVGMMAVGPGMGVGLLPNDIHSVGYFGDTVVRHLHLYGRDVKQLTERLMFDLETHVYQHMPLITVDEWN